MVPMKRMTVAFVLLVTGALTGSFLVGPVLSGKSPDQGGAAAATGIPKELTSFRDVVKKVLPAVVSIESKLTPPRVRERRPPRRPSGDDDSLPKEFLRFFEEMEKRQFEIPNAPSRGFGSGFVVDPKGVILTNFHVVSGAKQVQVQFMDGTKYVTKDIHGDRKTDLAIVRIDAKGKNLPYLELGDSEAMEIGDRVLAVGAPFGLTVSVTSGIVSAKGRNGLNMNMYEDFL